MSLTQGKRTKIVQVMSLSNFEIESEDSAVQVLDGSQVERESKNIKLYVGQT